MFSFLNKNTNNETSLLDGSISIVINHIDHESLIAGVLLMEALNGHCTSVTVSDIRDPLKAADRYIYLGVGNLADLVVFYRSGMTRSMITAVTNSAIFLNHGQRDESKTIRMEEQLLWQVCTLVDELGLDAVDIRRWIAPSEDFNKLTMDKEEFLKYLSFVNHAYRVFHGVDEGEVWISTSFGNTKSEDPNEAQIAQAEVEEVLARVARANKNLAGKVMQSVFMTKRVTLITTMGPDIFLLLRRLTNRGDIIHRAASPYGEVVYGSAEFQELAEQDLQTKLYIASPVL